jgi:hypothetical protein
MLRPIPLKDAAGADLVPQAIIRKPISYFHDVLRIELTSDHDDLDEYEGALLSFHRAWTFALKHYMEHPGGTTTVYLPREFESVEKISRTIQRILEELKLPLEALSWQRCESPDL